MFERLQRLRHPQDGLFVLAGVLSLGYGSVFALLAEVRDAFGFSEFAIGVIGGAAFVAGFAAQVGLARYADRGHGEALLKLGVLTAAMGAGLLIFAESLFLWVVARALLGFGAGCVFPAVRRVALTADPARAGESIGRMSAFEITGFLLGPVMASVLNAVGGLRAPFIGLMILLLALAPLAWRVSVPGSSGQSEPGVLKRLIRIPALQASLAAGIAFYITIGVFEAIWAVFLADRGASQMFIGLTMSAFALPMVFIAPWAGKISQERGSLLVATYSIGIAIVCMLIYGVIDSLWILCIPLAIHAIADAFTMPANQISVGRASPDEAIAAGQGLYGATGLAVAAVSAILSGALYQTLGAVGLWWISASVMALFLAFAWWRGAELRSPETRTPEPRPAS